MTAEPCPEPGPELCPECLKQHQRRPVTRSGDLYSCPVCPFICLGEDALKEELARVQAMLAAKKAPA